MRLINPSYLRKMLMLETAFTFCGNAKTDFQKVLWAIEECPTIDAELVRHGHWIRKPHWCVSCSCCGKNTHDYEGEVELYNFCPYCGADMREEVSE